MSQLPEDRQRREKDLLEPALRRSPERRPEFRTSSGLPLERLYLPADPDPDYPDKLGISSAIASPAF